MKKKRTIVAVLAMVLTLGAGLAGCSTKSREIAFADVGWDSVKFHNAVAGLVAESAFGYTWKEMPGSSPIMHEALKNGEIDVNMESGRTTCRPIMRTGMPDSLRIWERTLVTTSRDFTFRDT